MMMKKLLVLMLVLGMASLASAGLSIRISGEPGAGEQFSVILSGLVSDLGGGEIAGAIETAIAADDHGVIKPTVGLGSTTDSFGAFGTYDFSIGVGNDVTGWTSDGDWVEVVFTAGLAGTSYEFALQDGTFSHVYGSEIGVTVTPEPMTMVLLGLGGLFLRRRK